jgi:uncharacterized membrane protein YecN with MAPEG domain
VRLRYACTAWPTATAALAELQSAIRAHGNAVEYIPIALLLLLFLEMDGAATWMVHLCGLIIILGRLMHYYGFSSSSGTLATRRHELATWLRAGAHGGRQPLVSPVGVGFLTALSAQYAPFVFPGIIRYVTPRHAVFRPNRQKLGDWTFDERVAEVLPGYDSALGSRLFQYYFAMIGMLAERFVQPIQPYLRPGLFAGRRHAFSAPQHPSRRLSKSSPSITPQRWWSAVVAI